jgi:hypothetical protein
MAKLQPIRRPRLGCKFWLYKLHVRYILTLCVHFCSSSLTVIRSATFRTLRKILQGRSWGLFREAEAEEVTLLYRATCQYLGEDLRRRSDAVIQ